MGSGKNIVWLFVGMPLLFLTITCLFFFNGPGVATSTDLPPAADSAADGQYIVLAWNDLGMHCYNRSFQDLAVLPPYNTLWAQVIRVGDPPLVVTQDLRVTYAFPENTYSVGKSNFWDYEDKLFGQSLPDNVGLAGKGLAGDMDLAGDHFVAEGIPLTEFRDSDWNTPYPYQLATIEVFDSGSGSKLAETITVAPVSTEMHCDYCHSDGGVEGITTGRVETNILTLHDRENAGEYPPGHTGNLMDRRPILCAECHASNALNLQGAPGIDSLSRVMHETHAEKVTADINGCYNCHPGPKTQCLRDTMYQQGMTCIDCHGTMSKVAENPNPWLNEPRCDNAACHGSDYALNHPLYRMSSDHGGVYCEGCHDSPHAIAPTNQNNDAIKFWDLQGHNGPVDTCTVCHATQPTEDGPHGISAPTVPPTPVPPPPRLEYPIFLPSMRR